MEALTLLERLNINPDEPALLVTAEEALEDLLETIKKYCPNLRICEMKKEDVKTLLETYGNCIIDYHPEAHHQKRAALLKNFEMLKHYGLTDDDYDSLDFY
jgi:hypothetical protein